MPRRSVGLIAPSLPELRALQGGDAHALGPFPDVARDHDEVHAVAVEELALGGQGLAELVGVDLRFPAREEDGDPAIAAHTRRLDVAYGARRPRVCPAPCQQGPS